MKAESIEYILDQLGGDGSYRRSGNHLMGNCVHGPWGHHSGRDKDHKLGVLVTQGMSPLNCFYPGCLPDDARTLLGLVQLIGGKRVGDGLMSPDELSNLKSFLLMAEEDDDVLGDESWGKTRPKEQIPQNVSAACNGVAPFWVARGITPETAAEWKLGQDEFRAHIPFLNQAGEIVAIQGRLLPGLKKDGYAWEGNGQDGKFRSFPAGFERSELLVGEHRITQPVDWLLVVESPFDAIALTDWLRSDPGAALPPLWAVVATMGGEVSDRQVQKMVEFLSADGELVLGMDTDYAGRAATRQLVGLDKNFQKHRLYRRIANITEVEWVRKDATDAGDEKAPPDVVRSDALASIRKRESSLEKRLRFLVA